jgi:hypothetical protein
MSHLEDTRFHIVLLPGRNLGLGHQLLLVFAHLQDITSSTLIPDFILFTHLSANRLYKFLHTA